MFSIIYGLIFVFLLLVVAFVIVLFAEVKQKNAFFGGLESVLFLVMMPKSNLKDEDLMKKEEKAIISQMEQIFSNFLSCILIIVYFTY